MKRILAFLSLFIFGFLHHPAAQQVQLDSVPGVKAEVVWSDAEKLDRKQRSVGLLGADAEVFYVLSEKSGRGRTREYYLLRYRRENLQKIGEQLLDLPEFSGEGLRMYSFDLYTKGLLLIGTANADAGGRLGTYGVWYSKEGKRLGPPVLLYETVNKRRSEPEDFGVTVSADSTLLLIHRENSINRKANERFDLKVLDLNLEIVWQKEIELPYRSDLFEINQYLLDERGHVYMMTGIRTEKAQLQQEESPLSEKRYVLVTYDPDLNKVKEFEVGLDDKWVISTASGLTSDGNLAIGGFYSNDRYFSIAGTFFFRIDGETKEVVAKGLKAFDDQFLKQFIKERRLEKDRELDNFYFDHFIVREDGGASFVAEQFYVSQRFRADITTGRQEIQYFYHYNDVIVVDVLPDGNIHWAVKIPKEQVTMNDDGRYSSYALTEDGENLFVVFNDHPDNYERLRNEPGAEPRNFNSTKNSVVAVVSINEQGEYFRAPLLESKDERTVLKPKVHLSMASGELLIYAQYRRHYRFGRFNFKSPE